MNSQDGKGLIERVEEYFKTANLPKGTFKPNSYTTMHDARHFVDRSIAALKSVRPFTAQFNAAYHNLLQFKKDIEIYNEKHSSGTNDVATSS